MASFSLRFLLSFLSVLYVTVLSESGTTSKPDKFVLPVHQDDKTNLYVADIYKRTPPLQIPFVVDLNGRSLWVTCEENYFSSTYRAPRCHSTQCARADAHDCHSCSSKARPGCHNNTCGLVSVNPVTGLTSMGELAQDVLSIHSTPGSNLGPLVKIPQFLFTCAPSVLLQTVLPGNVQGVVGLGHSPISLSTQLASYFGFAGFAPTFTLCLSTNGVIFFGGGPYYMHPGIDISRPLSYTPLIISPQGEYYIEVKSIKINNNDIPINATLLLVDRQGLGGTKLSTVNPYTILQHSIFKSVTEFFTKELSGIPPVNPVEPFGVCFNSKSINKGSRVGSSIPDIDLVLHDQHVVWRISGSNSVVEAAPGVSCLAFVDGGLDTRASIVIGAYQMENNLLQFDLARSRLGFISSLLFFRTSCNNFNFTAVP